MDVTKSSCSYEEALSYARRLTHHDPLSEEAHREVMRLCFLLGRTTDALEQPRSFRIRRPRATTIGSRPAIDARVLEYLGELDGLLRKAVFAPDAVRETDRQAVPRARMSAEDNGSGWTVSLVAPRPSA